MAPAAQKAAEIAGQRPYRGTFPAIGLEHGMVGIGAFDQLEPVDLDLARLQLDHLAFAGQVIGAFAIDLDRRKRGGV